MHLSLNDLRFSVSLCVCLNDFCMSVRHATFRKSLPPRLRPDAALSDIKLSDTVVRLSLSLWDATVTAVPTLHQLMLFKIFESVTRVNLQTVALGEAAVTKHSPRKSASAVTTAATTAKTKAIATTAATRSSFTSTGKG